MLEHARYAKSLQVPQAVSPDNGQMVRLAPGPAKIIDETPSGRLHLEGNLLTSSESSGLRERKKIANGGYILISIVLAKGKVADAPLVVARGLSEQDGSAADDSLEAIDDAVDAAIRKLSREDLGDDERIERAMVRSVRRASEQAFGKRPLVDIAVHRI